MIIFQCVHTKVAKLIVSDGTKTQVHRAVVRNFSSSEGMEYFSSRE